MRSFSKVQMGVGAVALAATAALAVPWYAGLTLRAELRSLAAAHAEGNFRIARLEHEAGWLHSRGSLDLEWRSDCATDPDQPAVVHVEYTARHVPDRESLTRIDWSAAVASDLGPSGEGLRAGRLSGTGSAGYDGVLRSDMRLPEMQFKGKGQSLVAAASSGTLVVGGSAVKLGWSMPRMVLRGSGEVLQAEQLNLHFDVQNHATGMGALALDVATLKGASFNARGLHLSTETRQRADRMDMRLTQSVKELKAADMAVEDVVLQADVTNLHAPSVNSAGEVLSATCGLRSLTPGQREKMRDAVQALLVSGVSVGITKLQARTRDGSLDADVALTVAPAKARELQLAEQLSSQGSIQIRGGLMPPDQKEFAVSSGYATALPDGVKAGFDYRDGVLKFNQKTADSALLNLGLQRLDMWLNAFFSGQNLELPQEEEPAVAPSELPMPAPAV